jgi:zinc protease
VPQRRRRLLALRALALGLGLAGVASAAPQRLTLANGIEVILDPEPGRGEIAVVVWVPVGGRDDRPPRSGRAHLFEHLMFAGTKRVPAGRLDRLVEEAGGWSNATTTPDATVYTTVAGAGALERVLWLEADRLAGVALDVRVLTAEKEIIVHERRDRFEARPYGAADALQASALWPAGHPYHHPTIGSADDVAAVTLDEARRYFADHYAPQGLVVAISGDFGEIEAILARTLGALPPRPRPPRPQPPAPAPLAKEVVVQADDQVGTTRLYLAWRTPPWYGASDAPLAVTAGILGGGRAGRLWRRLVVERPLADDLDVVTLDGELGGTFQIVVSLRVGVDAREVVAVIDRELAELATKGPGADELLRARRQLEASLLEASQALATRAHELARGLAATGTLPRREAELDRLRAVSGASVRELAASVLAPSRRVRLTIGPAAP